MRKEKNACLEKRLASKKTISVLHSCSRIGLPKISMEGKWLEELGFQIVDSLQMGYGNQYIYVLDMLWI